MDVLRYLVSSQDRLSKKDFDLSQQQVFITASSSSAAPSLAGCSDSSPLSAFSVLSSVGRNVVKSNNLKWQKCSHMYHGIFNLQFQLLQFRTCLSGTFEFELVLELFVNLVFVKLGVGSLKVKVFVKLHCAIPAHIYFASAAVSSSTATAVRRLNTS